MASLPQRLALIVQTMVAEAEKEVMEEVYSADELQKVQDCENQVATHVSHREQRIYHIACNMCIRWYNVARDMTDMRQQVYW